MSAEVALPATVDLVVHIGGGLCGKTPWMCTKAQHINGKIFIPLCVADTGFSRFVTGGRELGQYKYLERLKTARNRALYIDENETEDGPQLFPNMKSQNRTRFVDICYIGPGRDGQGWEAHSRWRFP